MQMFSAKSIIALFLAAAFPSAILAQEGVTCQTTAGSPKTESVTDVINQLRGHGGTCEQTNCAASKCTTMLHHGGAALVLCGECNKSLDCSTVADYANEIQQDCLSDGRAGGTYTVSPAFRVEVISS
ncbi:hypothetical protein UCDDS831_g03143 [Diplodia seriata]|uniref:Uncharacterized protein n=1 Tax=Diplodia seriata TaxID=420778 RepID=A0A0G2EKX1_9PEZI|nr:hypothetical protein UCDDS831_g03143 [Diplodia seriata]